MRRQRERIARLLTLNAGLLGVVVVLQGIYLMRQEMDCESAQTVATVQDTDNEEDEAPVINPPRRDGMNGPTEPVVEMMSNPVEAYLRSAMGPIRTAAADHGMSTKGILPSEEAVVAAVATGSFDAPQTRAVLDDLENAYAEFNMPFPDRTLSSPVSGVSGPGEVAQATQGDILGAFFQVTRTRLVRAAEAAGDDPDSVLPTDAEIAQATRSGDVNSDASSKVLTRLRIGYERYDLRFPDPADSLSAD